MKTSLYNYKVDEINSLLVIHKELCFAMPLEEATVGNSLPI